MKRFFLLLSILVLGWMFFANYSKVELDEILHDSEIPVSTKGRSGIEVRSHDRPRVSEVLSPQEAKIDLSDAESKTSERKPEGDGFIKKVLSEKWLDDEGKAGRRRIRIVEADFKYPRIRLEETVWMDPETGEQRVERNLASVADHVMVGVKLEGSEDLVCEVLKRSGYAVRAVEAGSYILAEINDFSRVETQTEAISNLEAIHEHIAYAEPDYIVNVCGIPNDPAFQNLKMWGLHNEGILGGRKVGSDIDAAEAWDVRTDASGVVVAVTDTGVSYTHEDLASNMWIHPVNGDHGFDAYDDDDDPMDVDGHGTHCAGILGAQGNNGKGLAGVAWDMQIMAGRFIGPYGGPISDAVRVINYSRENGASVINASWGGRGFSFSLQNAIRTCGDEGIIFVVAAGNAGQSNDSSITYPSGYNLSNIVSVASTDSQDKLSYFSSYGRYTVDLGAPGSDIWSTYIGSDSSYRYLNGTSMAAPLVSGALALAKAHFSEDHMDSLINRLYSSVDRIPSLNGIVLSGGRLNLNRLLADSTAKLLHDDYENALLFEGDYAFWGGSNRLATREDFENTFSFSNTGNRSMWFAWQPPYQGFSTLKVGARSSLSTPARVVVFKVAAEGALVRIADSEGLEGISNQGLRFFCEPDQEYRFLVDDDSEEGQSIGISLNLMPSNDQVAEALEVVGDRFISVGSNRGASKEIFEEDAPHAGVGAGRSVWWKWTSDIDGEFVLSTQDSDFDTVLAVYSGNIGNLTEVASNDDRNPFDWTSQITFMARSGVTYYIAVDSYKFKSEGRIILNGFLGGQLKIIKQPESFAVVIGARAELDVAVLSGGVLTYQWFKDDDLLVGEVRNTLVLDSVTLGDFGVYHVKISNGEVEVVSDPVELVEEKRTPAIVWKSANQTVSNGVNTEFFVKVLGSQPLSYQWFKNGVKLGGEVADSFEIPSTATNDSGVYRLEVRNQLGVASAEIYLDVVASPWDTWEWRRPGVPRSAITDIKVDGASIYAVSGNTILHTGDGVVWNRSKLPPHFYGYSLERLADGWVCIGKNADGDTKVALSDNGLDWTLASVVGLSSYNQYLLKSFGGQLIAQTAVTWHSSGSSLYYSSDGVNWQPCQQTTLTGEKTNMYGKGRIASDGDTLMIASGWANSDFQKWRYLVSSDGVNWIEKETNAVSGYNSSYNEQCQYVLGRFYLFGTFSALSSSDGVAWEGHSYENYSVNGGSLLAGDESKSYIFSPREQTLRWFDSVSGMGVRSVFPTDSLLFTAVAMYNGNVVYGTDKGVIKLASDPYDVSISFDRSSKLDALQFRGGQFVVTSDSTVFSGTVPPLISGDGITWKESTLIDDREIQYSGHALGEYWGVDEDGKIVIGANSNYVGQGMSRHRGLLAPVPWIEETENGDVLAVAKESENFETLNLFYSSDRGLTWQAVNPPFTVYVHTKFIHFKGRWFTSDGVAGSNEVYSSQDGMNWGTTGIQIRNGEIVKTSTESLCIMGGDAFGNLTVYRSLDGVSWSLVPTTGIPMASHLLHRLLTFNGALVALIKEDGLYYSQDGGTWLRWNSPDKIKDIAVGNGRLVAILENGGIAQVGGGDGGGNAPLVKINSPQPSNAHLLGSNVLVQGTVSDPEEGAVTFECYLDGVMVRSGYGEEFEYTIRVSNLTGHQFFVRAVDSYGLEQTSGVILTASLAEPENSMMVGEGKNFLPSDYAVEMGGVFYVAGSRMLYRSIDGESWERVSLPSVEHPIYSMAAGNGVLVIQLSNGSMISSSDGVNWTHFLLNWRDYYIRSPLMFEHGRFIADYQTSSGYKGSIMSSVDGFQWDISAESSEGYLAWRTYDGGPTVLGALGYGAGVYFSKDGGNNWRIVEGLSDATAENSHGVYAQGKFSVVNSATQKIHFSSDGKTWDITELPGGVTSKPVISFCDGRYFLGHDGAFQYSSPDAINWQLMNTDVNERTLARALGLFVSVDGNGAMWSEDGVTWHFSQEEESPTSSTGILFNGYYLLNVDLLGQAWRSMDGKKWRPLLRGRQKNAIDEFAEALKIERLGDRLILAGNRGLLQFSDDDGHSWSAAVFDGSIADSSLEFSRLVAGESVAMVSTSFHGGLYKTLNGSTWSKVDLEHELKVVDIAWNGSVWMIQGQGGELRQSIDGGVTWTVVAAEQIKKGGGIAWFRSRWVVFGAIEDGHPKPHHAFTLSNELGLVDHGALSFGNSLTPVFKVIAHEKMIIWQRGENPIMSADGVNWHVTPTTAGHGGWVYDIAPDSDGFVILRGAGAGTYSTLMWKYDSVSQTWNSIASRYNNVRWSDTVDGRVFMFGQGLVFEESNYDVSLSIQTLADVSLGVGDTLEVVGKVENLGVDLGNIEGWKVEAYLSKDQFGGDGNDVYIGSVPLRDGMPSHGMSKTMPLEFIMPNQIGTGSYYLMLKLVNENGVDEINPANNSAFSVFKNIFIPEWALDLTASGQGQVHQDIAAARYPHKSRVSLMANASKGAAFTGWAGDAVGAQSQITVVMDTDKSVQANFSSRVNLQVLTRGGGNVTGVADLGSYAVDATATITAVPISGWEFTGWTGAASGAEATTSIVMGQSKAVTARFVFPYSNWETEQFTHTELSNQAMVDDDADPDLDGFKNWQEYLHGSNPKDASSKGVISLKVDGDWLYAIFTRNSGAEGGYALACEATRDMADWNASDRQERILSSVRGIDTVEVRLPVSGGNKGFLRFKYRK